MFTSVFNMKCKSHDADVITHIWHSQMTELKSSVENIYVEKADIRLQLTV